MLAHMLWAAWRQLAAGDTPSILAILLRRPKFGWIIYQRSLDYLRHVPQ